MEIEKLKELSKLIRYYIIKCTTEAGSGHPTSSLSATDLMNVLFFKYLKYDTENPKNLMNDRIIFSKGHAAPLLYSLYAAANIIKEEELLTLRKFGSDLEGHPTPKFKYVDVATGSLGQGLSIGLGMALCSKYLDKLNNKIYVLMGDSEMSEGSIWEAIELSGHYNANNLIGIIDVNRLGQRGETMFGHNLEEYEKKINAFNWKSIIINGHDYEEINKAFEKAINSDKPFMIIAKTIKGKGIKFIEDKNGWHGKAIPKDKYEEAIKNLGDINKEIKGKINKPEKLVLRKEKEIKEKIIEFDKKIATRKVYGITLNNIFNEEIVVVDGEVDNSTFAHDFHKEHPNNFFECYIAEQNMVGIALGFSKLGKIPFVGTFSAFLTRAYDQIRMSQYSKSNIKFIGSHCGVSIGADGSSQMGLEDISMFRSIQNCTIFYPSDAIACQKLIILASKIKGNVYIRTTRADTPIIYSKEENFEIGGFNVLKESEKDIAVIISAGITLHESLKAYNEVKNVKIIDLYCIKPINKKKLVEEINKIKKINGKRKVICVEDHYEEGGIGEALKSILFGEDIDFIHLCVRKMPTSGKPEELLRYEEIDKEAILKEIKKIIEIKK